MEFGQPHHVEPEPLGGVDLFHGLVEGLALGPAGERRKLVEHAEFHDRSLFPLRKTMFNLAKLRRQSQARSLAPLPLPPDSAKLAAAIGNMQASPLRP